MATQTDEALAALTERQRQVYDLAKEGMRPSDIARELSLSPNGVQGHLNVLRSRKLLPKSAGSSKSSRSRSSSRSSASRRSNGATAVTGSDAEVRPAADAGRAVLTIEGVPSLEKTVHEIDERLTALDVQRERLLAIKNAAQGVPA